MSEETPPTSLHLLALMHEGPAHLITSQDMTQITVCRLPGGLVTLCLSLSTAHPLARSGHSTVTVTTDPNNAARVVTEYLSSPHASDLAGEEAPVEEMTPECAETSEAPILPSPKVLPELPRTGSTGGLPGVAGGARYTKRQRKDYERHRKVVKAASVSVSDLAEMPRPLDHAHAAADLLHRAGQKISSRILGRAWGWSNSTVYDWLRSTRILAPGTRAAVDVSLAGERTGEVHKDMVAELDAMPRPVNWHAVARYLRISAETKKPTIGNAASMASRWGWDVALMARLQAGVEHQLSLKAA